MYSTTPTSRRWSRLLSLLVLACAGALMVAGHAALSADKARFVSPIVATLAVYALFIIQLHQRLGVEVFGELGFVYVGLLAVYTVVPGMIFVVLDLDGFAKIASILPTFEELSRHLWRHVLYACGVCAGYLLVRGNGAPARDAASDRPDDDPRLVPTLIAVIACCVAAVSLLSAPVTEYIDHYTRFEHLSWALQRVAYVCLALKAGSYFVLLTFLFRSFRKRWGLTLISITGICAYELVYSFGSRVATLTIVLGAVVLYHQVVKPIRLRQGAIALVMVGAFFSLVELFRSSGYDLSMAGDTVAEKGVMPASEFGAVYFTGFHLYSERAQGSMPRPEWPMLFSEAVQLAPFADHTRWNPLYWYARNYFPDARVPPETMGPIAESAIWGGEVDLVIRSLINGAFFAWIVRWYLKRQSRWWALTIYAYCYATSVMTLKYTVFYHLVPVFQIVLPSILVAAGIQRLYARSASPARDEATPHLARTGPTPDAPQP